ncbi:FAD-dependent oxidoreductase [Homoserinimonas sp. OAct 916]|uniref:FAD-dependent oxidoreductase n=1 Tax=Homoserinimonas sp. OAct 916 TaxID=2211450 RepID=UPI000DBEA0E1|nr:FAD-dependent oxidoreductase [Homoserinimonas sp. OAct 916]
MTDRSVLVSGGGVAGATVAYWLARAGWSVTIVERADGTRSSGNPVDVRGEAVAIARQMGIWPRLEEAATGVNRLTFVDADGRPRASIRTHKPGDHHEEVELARNELVDLLLDKARESTLIIPHDSITVLHEDSGGIDVEFERTPSRRFDLMIGADGVHSTVRRLAFGPEEHFSRPFGMFVGTVQAPLQIEDPLTVLMYNEPGTSLSIHPAGGKPGFAFIFRGQHNFDYRDPEHGRRLVESTYASGGWLTTLALKAWGASDDRYFDEVTRVDVPQWSAGRVVLLGDAASCISLFGDGSSSAIVGAQTLADAITAYPDNHTAAFAHYQQKHRKHIRPLRRGAGISSRLLVPKTRAGIILRNGVLNTLPFRNKQQTVPPSSGT